jgi:CRP/FNR family nitrogen fixation transcriptional regulator
VVFPGGICGLASGEYHDATCETLTPSVLRSHKVAELGRSEALRARVIAGLQSQIAAMHDHTVSLGRKTAEERVCSLIVRLHDVMAGGSAHATVALPMTRTEIADYLGLTLETFCRTISDLRRRGVVEDCAKRNEVHIPDMGRLRVIACCDA